jgi:formate hydrogenlyase subunit 3/multisubunit Na+/H+ antiporter MnhD subunit
VPFTVIVLPFAATLFLVLIEALFPAEKYRWSYKVAVTIAVAGLGASTVMVWIENPTTADNAFFFTPVAQLFLTFLFTLASISLLVAYFTANLKSGRYAPVTLTVCGTINAALFINNVFVVTLCFVAAEFFSIISVVDVGTEDEERFVRVVKSAVRYLIVTVLFGLLLFVAQVFLERVRLDPQQIGLIKVIVALAITGFALRFGVFPFNLWLPQVIEDAPALASWLVLGLINGAAVIFLVDFLQQNPTLLLNNTSQTLPVMALGMSGAVLSGLFGMAQSSFGKMLAYTGSGNLSLVLFGLATPHTTGLHGAVFEAANFALAQLLIFTSLAVIYYCNYERVIKGLSGLGRHMPVATVGLSFGMLALAGAPLISGFPGKYLILQSAAQEGIGWALLGGLAITLWLLAYLRFFHNQFMGRDIPGLKTKAEPIGTSAIILLLIAVMIFFGIWSALPLDWLGSALKAS